MSGPNPPDLKRTNPDQDSMPSDRTRPDIHSRAYSAPESEQFTSAPYVPPDPALYDYDSYEPADPEQSTSDPRGGRGSSAWWPSSPPSPSSHPWPLLVTRTDNTGPGQPGDHDHDRRRPCRTRSPPTTPPPPPPPPPPPTPRRRRRLAGDRHRHAGEPPPPPPPAPPRPPPPPPRRPRTAAAADHDHARPDHARSRTR